MRTCLVFLTIVLLARTVGVAQKCQLEWQSGYGTYGMRDLKNLQANLSPIVGLGQTTQNFPPYWFYRGRISFKIGSEWRTGVAIGSMSTGARTDYQDFSGKMRFDQTVIGNSIGFFNSYDVKAGKKIIVAPQFTVWKTNSTVKVDQMLGLTGSPTQTQTDTFKSSSWMVEFNLQGTYSLGALRLGAFLGYNVDLQGKLKEDGATYSAKTDWSGLRTGAVIGVVF